MFTLSIAALCFSTSVHASSFSYMNYYSTSKVNKEYEPKKVFGIKVPSDKYTDIPTKVIDYYSKKESYKQSNLIKVNTNEVLESKRLIINTFDANNSIEFEKMKFYDLAPGFNVWVGSEVSGMGNAIFVERNGSIEGSIYSDKGNYSIDHAKDDNYVFSKIVSDHTHNDHIEQDEPSPKDILHDSIIHQNDNTPDLSGHNSAVSLIEEVVDVLPQDTITPLIPENNLETPNGAEVVRIMFYYNAGTRDSLRLDPRDTLHSSEYEILYSRVVKAVTELNVICINSHINLWFEIAGMQYLDYDLSTGNTAEINRLNSLNNFGDNSEVQLTRNYLAADINVMIADRVAEDLDAGGIADFDLFNLNPNVSNESILLDDDGFREEGVLAHEVGHLFGANHNMQRGQLSHVSYGHGLCKYEEGWRTVMSYLYTDPISGRSCGNKILYFSNPGIKHIRTGTSLGSHDWQNVSRLMREGASKVANYRNGPTQHLVAGSNTSSLMYKYSGAPNLSLNEVNSLATVDFGKRTSTKVTPDGQMYRLDEQNHLWKLVCDNRRWQHRIDGENITSDACSIENVQLSTTWVPFNGDYTTAQFDVSDSGTVYRLATDNSIWRSTNEPTSRISEWESIYRPYVGTLNTNEIIEIEASVGERGENIYMLVNEGGDIYVKKYNGSGWVWLGVTPLKDIVDIAADGDDLYTLDNLGVIRKYNKIWMTWDAIGSGIENSNRNAKLIEANDGSLYKVNYDNSVWKYGKWSHNFDGFIKVLDSTSPNVRGGVKQIEVMNENIFIVNNHNEVYMRDYSIINWSGAIPIGIALSDAEKAYMVDSHTRNQGWYRIMNGYNIDFIAAVE